MSNALSVYALCVVVLFLKMFMVSCYQGYHRLRFVAFTNPEDAAVFKHTVQAAEQPEVIRAAKVWANDLENIPAFFALGGLAIALDTAAQPTVWLSLAFTLARGLPAGCAAMENGVLWHWDNLPVGLLRTHHSENCRLNRIYA
ncbi:hypothetical protein GLGCALEP_03811 [Pseudomonas sp. MM221]|nr:hypothetical protein DBADOPDK_03726 [Pseudomonas sp. MM223]CAI3805731.1 hypothetical protein GLGCALEP_03811 [Pseudomonas sp. MM221]